MNHLLISVALLGASASASALAQSTPSNDQTAATQMAAVSQSGQWTAPYGQPVAGKTRAQVYQELVPARQDGQIAYLNSLYRGR